MDVQEMLPQLYNRGNKSAKYDVQRKASSMTSIYLGCYGGYLIYSVTSLDFGDRKGRQLFAHCDQSTA